MVELLFGTVRIGTAQALAPENCGVYSRWGAIGAEFGLLDLELDKLTWSSLGLSGALATGACASQYGPAMSSWDAASFFWMFGSHGDAQFRPSGSARGTANWGPDKTVLALQPWGRATCPKL